jgi:hypothetical protein
MYRIIGSLVILATLGLSVFLFSSPQEAPTPSQIPSSTNSDDQAMKGLKIN